MKLAYLSPLPPKKTGIATYSAHLLPHLMRHFDISAMDFGPELNWPNAIDLFSMPSYRASLMSYPMRLYHLGNNPHFHLKLYQVFLESPGIVVLHDTVLYFLMAGDGIGGLAKECNETFPGRGLQTALEILHQTPSNNLLLYGHPGNYPLVNRVLKNAQGIIVHNKTSKQTIEKMGYKGAIEVIPLLSYPIENYLSTMDRATAKRSAGLKSEEIIFGCFGFIGKTKRIDKILQALARIQSQIPNFTLIIVGEGESLEPWINKFGLSSKVKLYGFVTEEEYVRFLSACDIVINLRYPSMGETSATLMQAFAIAKPCLVTNHAWFAELPNDAVVKIPYDDSEVESLAQVLIELTTNENSRNRIGSRARTWAQNECSPDKIAKLYASFIHSIIQRSQHDLQVNDPKAERFASGEAIKYFNQRILSITLK